MRAVRHRWQPARSTSKSPPHDHRHININQSEISINHEPLSINHESLQIMNKESESGIYLVVFACVKQTVSSRSEFMCQQPVTMFYSFKSLLFFCSERAEAISVTTRFCHCFAKTAKAINNLTQQSSKSLLGFSSTSFSDRF